ncbi:LysR family transcriptional regulator [Streptomyces flavofungini]|uniref:LysR family transcriptional regulator n=1 Tax=Streptomyces flavofungini TaxID=68200 RepID=A0ABS0XEJ8_9ACTN|nr:LysR family transcriptional regulator [Streptomyces flavofungini]MBJ3811648.1 LysR family transcriptional regulator [Streptomyces flavofungini]GHC86483.1 LysR family transcriptional regulator [Streptomyces flavofungini]
MELRQLQYFAAVADEGGFSRAAERLGVVQSAVSQQVRRLERELGVALFDRSTRHVHLSAAGERLLPEARAVLAAADRIRRVAADVASGDEGLLRLGTVQGPGDRTYRLLDALRRTAPRLRVRLRRLPLTERLAAVRSGELDAALVRAVPRAPGLELLPVWRDPLYVALPADHPAAARSDGGPEPASGPAPASAPPLRLEQVADLPLRLAPREHNPPFHDLVTGALRAVGAEPLLGPPFTTLQETLTGLAEQSADSPSWTVFYEVTGLPPVPRVAVRRLAAPELTTSLAALPGPPGPPLRHLLQALRA